MSDPEQVARRWREKRVAQSRRDVELETFPTTGGSRSKNASPMYGQPRHRKPPAGCELLFPVVETAE